MSHPDNLSQAFDELYRTNYVKVFRLAHGLANRSSTATDRDRDAEDITQEAFLRAFRLFSTFKQESSFFTWICRIAINVANDYMKQRSRLRIYDTVEELRCTEAQLADPSPGNDPETRLLSNEVLRFCMQGFTETLSLRQKKVFLLVVGFGLPYQVAAEILECSVGSLKTALHRAKEKLAGYLETRCSLVSSANPCRCDQWVKASLAHGRITRDCLSSPTATIAVPEKVKIYLQDLREIYTQVYQARSDAATAEILKEGFARKRWATFT